MYPRAWAPRCRPASARPDIEDEIEEPNGGELRFHLDSLLRVHFNDVLRCCVVRYSSISISIPEKGFGHIESVCLIFVRTGHRNTNFLLKAGEMTWGGGHDIHPRTIRFLTRTLDNCQFMEEGLRGGDGGFDFACSTVPPGARRKRKTTLADQWTRAVLLTARP